MPPGLLFRHRPASRVPERIRTGSPLAEVIWREVHDHDTSTARGAFPYQRAVGDRESFEVIGRLALQAGAGVTGQLGEAESHLFAAPRLVAFVMDWLTGHFGYRD